jgi:DNA-binding MarR family transcriptional regulator
VTAPHVNVSANLIELYDLYVRLLTRRTHSRMMALNLTQWRTLTLIRFNPGRTQRSLATVVGVDPSSMTPIVDFFEQKRWVRRHRSATNRSAHALRMTPTGLKAYRLVENEMGQLERLFVRLLGAPDRSDLVRLMRRLRERLATELAAHPSRKPRSRR